MHRKTWNLMAKTFNLDNAAQKDAYLEESLTHWLLYGEIHMSWDRPGGTVTIWEPAEIQIRQDAYTVIR